MSQLTIVVSDDGKLAVFANSGPSFEAAAAAINKVYANLGMAGVTVTDNTVPEQHRHEDPTLQRLHQATHQ
jgi:hypothetical protein